MAQRAARQDAAVVAEDLDLVAQRRPADVPGRRVEQRRARGDDHVAFGLAVELVQRQAQFRMAPFEQLLAQRLAAARGRAQRQRPAGARRRHQAQHPQRRRRQEGAGDPMARHQVESGLGVELGEAPRQHRHAVVPGRQQHVEQAADPRPVGRRPDQVAVPGKGAVGHLHAGQVTEEHAVGVQHALRLAGRAGGVDDDGRVVGGGVDRLEAVGLAGDRCVKGGRAPDGARRGPTRPACRPASMQ